MIIFEIVDKPIHHLILFPFPKNLLRSLNGVEGLKHPKNTTDKFNN